MRLIEKDPIWVDVDDTLVMWDEPLVPGPNKIEVWYGDGIKYLTPHKPNIDLIKEYKNRGYFLIVHSANGAPHVKRVVDALGLGDIFELGMTKCTKIVDDRPAEDWIGTRVYLPKDFYDKKTKEII